MVDGNYTQIVFTRGAEQSLIVLINELKTYELKHVAYNKSKDTF